MSNPYAPPAAEPKPPPQSSLSTLGCYLILITAFLGWMFAGVQMSITPLLSRSATVSLRWPDQSGKLSKRISAPCSASSMGRDCRWMR